MRIWKSKPIWNWGNVPMYFGRELTFRLEKVCTKYVRYPANAFAVFKSTFLYTLDWRCLEQQKPNASGMSSWITAAAPFYWSAMIRRLFQWFPMASNISLDKRQKQRPGPPSSCRRQTWYLVTCAVYSNPTGKWKTFCLLLAIWNAWSPCW